MERLELLRDTIILEAMNYTGEISPVLERENSLPGEFVGYMDELEKRLHTLSVLKNNEIGEMFESITSDLQEETTPDERITHIREVITSKDDFHLYEKFNKLQKEANACEELMSLLIKLRFIDINLTLEIRPGFQIVSLPGTEFSTLGMMGCVEN